VSDADGEAGPLEQALELCVYAPLGFALEARTLLPRFVERGRSQVMLARLIGRYAVGQGSSLAGGVVTQAAGQAQAGLARLGLVRPATSDRVASPVDPEVVSVARGSVPAEVPAVPPLDPATLAIPDYESLSASQVVPRLDGLDADELEAVRTYEAGTRRRKTILNKIAQLQSV
jgi:hypothetical protein